MSNAKQEQPKPKNPTKADLEARIKELEAIRPSSENNADVITDEDGVVARIIALDDPIGRALIEAVQEVVSHPTGDVNDSTFLAQWREGIAKAVSKKVGVQRIYVSATFHDTDRLNRPFEDENWVRWTVRVGKEARHVILQDPTPED